jgi:hypothetical protein
MRGLKDEWNALTVDEQSGGRNPFHDAKAIGTEN